MSNIEIVVEFSIFVFFLIFSWKIRSKRSTNWALKLYLFSLLTAERIWFKCDLPQRFIPPINLCKICIDLRPFSKYFNEPFSRTLRSPRSNNLKIPNNENYKWKLVKTRWNPKFGLSDLENDLLTSMTSEGAQWIF